MVSFDDSDTPPPTLFDPARADDPRAKEWADREVQYVQQIAQLKSELGQAHAEKATAILEKAKLALELNQLRRRVHRAAPKKE